MGKVVKVEHPLINTFIFKLRDRKTSSEIFRKTLSNVAKILLFEALKDEEVVIKPVKTPLEETVYPTLIEENFVIVAILRAGLPMLEGCLEVLPQAKSGFLGIKRDEETLQSTLYYKRVPDLTDKTVIVVDPMVATGGSISLALDYLKSKNPKKIKSLHVIASPEGIENLKKFEDVNFFVGEIDRGLNDKGYIVPGIGDAGDRAFNTED
ncbi:MAG: uracil phosphoribosyltransferase [Hydrogenothermaceae bacterium]|nr:uracil phosphoribosyltransferase [Hydrogenothermaceae bacterium]